MCSRHFFDLNDRHSEFWCLTLEVNITVGYLQENPTRPVDLEKDLVHSWRGSINTTLKNTNIFKEDFYLSESFSIISKLVLHIIK